MKYFENQELFAYILWILKLFFIHRDGDLSIVEEKSEPESNLDDFVTENGHMTLTGQSAVASDTPNQSNVKLDKSHGQGSQSNAGFEKPHDGDSQSDSCSISTSDTIIYRTGSG